jgi:hypothetical protein
MKVLLAVPLVLLALLGAAGISSLETGDYCWDRLSIVLDETDEYDSDWVRTLTPPGWRCTLDVNGRHYELTGGSWPWFLIAFAGAVGVGAWYFRRRTPAATAAFAATVALAVAGIAGWYFGAWETGFVVGFYASLPVGWIVSRRGPTAVLAAFCAVPAAGFLSLFIGAFVSDFGVGSVVGCWLAVALVATAARLLPARARPVSSS